MLCFARNFKPKADLPMSKNKKKKQCYNLCRRVAHVISILGVEVPKATLDVTKGKKIHIDGKWILTTGKGVRIDALESESDLIKWWMALQKMAGREGFASQASVALQARATRRTRAAQAAPAPPVPPRTPEPGASPPWQSSGDGNSMMDWDFD